MKPSRVSSDSSPPCDSLLPLAFMYLIPDVQARRYRLVRMYRARRFRVGMYNYCFVPSIHLGLLLVCTDSHTNMTPLAR